MGWGARASSPAAFGVPPKALEPWHGSPKGRFKSEASRRDADWKRPRRSRSRFSLNGSGLEQPHSLVMLLIPWERLIFGPPFLFQISHDVQPCRPGRLVTPKFAHPLAACKVVAQLAVPHPIAAC